MHSVSKSLHIVGLLLVVMLLGAWSSAQVVLSSFEARSDGADVVVSWKASLEDEVKDYALERKSRYDTEFKALTNLDSKGANFLYEFRDRTVYGASQVESDEQVEYRLRVNFIDGTADIVSPIAVDYTPTAVRRTWGSIKAMFQ